MVPGATISVPMDPTSHPTSNIAKLYQFVKDADEATTTTKNAHK